VGSRAGVYDSNPKTSQIRSNRVKLLKSEAGVKSQSYNTTEQHKPCTDGRNTR
jgi:hypothetical protein